MTDHESPDIIPLGAITSAEAQAFAASDLSAETLCTLINLDPDTGAGHDDMRRIMYAWCERHGIEGYLAWKPGDLTSLRYVMWPDATREGVITLVSLLKDLGCSDVITVVPDDDEDLDDLSCTVSDDGDFILAEGDLPAGTYVSPAAMFSTIEREALRRA